MTVVVGLTGSIAMGKSTVAAMFASSGVPVFDADIAVRAYYEGVGAHSVGEIFPGVLSGGRVDRERLGRLVLRDELALMRLERLVHPEVAIARGRFIERVVAEGRRLSVIDVPLLFETGGEANVDIVIVVSAPASTQRARALAREGMTNEKLDAILARQTADTDKQRKAHFIIDTRGDLERTRAQVAQFTRAVAGSEGKGARYA